MFMYSNKSTIRNAAGLLVAILFVAVAMVLQQQHAVAQGIPRTFSYQGVLSNNDGSPYPDGEYTIVFALYATETGGSALWTEPRTVTLTDGVMHVALGTVTPLSVDFDREYWLGITVGANPQFPRTRLTAVPYSLNVADGAVVRSLNGLRNDLRIQGGNNIDVETSDTTITISALSDNGFSLPFKDSIAFESSEKFDVPAFWIIKKGYGPTARFDNYAANDGMDFAGALLARNYGKGNAAEIEQLNENGTSSSLLVRNLGSGYGIHLSLYGTNKPDMLNSGIWSEVVNANRTAGSFTIEMLGNPDISSVPALRAATNGGGSAATFSSGWANNTRPVITAVHTGKGAGIQAEQRGVSSSAGYFINSNATNTEPTLRAINSGGGAAGLFSITNPGSMQVGLSVSTEGKGNGGKFAIMNDENMMTALEGTTNGLGSAGMFTTEADGAMAPTIVVVNKGKGPAIAARSEGMGAGGSFRIDNIDNSAAALLAYTKGDGPVMFLESDNAATSVPAVSISSRGTEVTMYVQSKGKDGGAGAFEVTDSTNPTGALFAGSKGSGTTFQATNSGTGDAIYGYNSGLAGRAGYFYNDDSDNGTSALVARTAGFGYALEALSDGTAKLAALFEGHVKITRDLSIDGVISKGGGSFKIDHPLDPANKYLYHSFVESPDMMNIYNGNIVLDANGEAIVELPEWFQALNREFRYQLTCIGGYAQVYIAEEIEGNKFRIAGGKGGLKVSWEVTGIRKDPFAERNRIPVEQAKAPEEQGYYLHPEAYGQPAEMSIHAAHRNSAAGSAIVAETSDSPGGEQ